MICAVRKSKHETVTSQFHNDQCGNSSHLEPDQSISGCHDQPRRFHCSPCTAIHYLRAGMPSVRLKGCVRGLSVIDLPRNGNSGFANEILGCAKLRLLLMKISMKMKQLGCAITWISSIASAKHGCTGDWLTLKHRETHGCVVSTVATDALVLKHQAISIHNAD